MLLSILAWRIPLDGGAWQAYSPAGSQRVGSGGRLTFHFHFHGIERWYAQICCIVRGLPDGRGKNPPSCRRRRRHELDPWVRRHGMHGLILCLYHKMDCTYLFIFHSVFFNCQQIFIKAYHVKASVLISLYKIRTTTTVIQINMYYRKSSTVTYTSQPVSPFPVGLFCCPMFAQQCFCLCISEMFRVTS